MLSSRTAIALVFIASLSINPPNAVYCAGALDQRSQELTSGAAVPGIKLYEQGDIKGAIKTLRTVVKQHPNDAEAWYYLGLALNRNNDPKGARKALESTIRLRPDYASAHAGLAYSLLVLNKSLDAHLEAEHALALDAQNAEAHYVIGVLFLRGDEPAKALESAEAALKSNPNFAAAFLLKSQALLSGDARRSAYSRSESSEARAQREERGLNLLKEAADALETYLKLIPSSPKADIWRELLETLSVYQSRMQTNSGDQRKIFLPSEVTTKARPMSRPEPQYTDEARKALVSGTVVIRAVFAVDGTIQNILVIRPLSHGLTEAAVRVARKIKFVPAIKDGRPVSQFFQVEYNFNVY